MLNGYILFYQKMVEYIFSWLFNTALVSTELYLDAK